MTNTAPPNSRGDPAPKTRVLRDSALYFGAQIGARVLNFFYFMILAWSLPTDEFGVLNYALSIIIVVDILIDLGLSRHAMREMSKNPELTGAFIIRLLPYKILAAGAVYFALSIWMGASHETSTYKLIFMISALGLFFSAPSMFLENVLQAHQRFALISVANIVLSVVQFSVGGAILLMGGSTTSVAFTFAVTYLAYAGLMLWGVWQLRPVLNWHLDVSALMRSLPPAFPYLCSALIVLLAIRAEFLILGRYGSPVDLGVFGMATKIVEAGLLLPIALSTVLAPRFAKAHALERIRLSDLYFSGFELLLLLALPAGLIAYGISPLVPIVLGDPNFGQIDQILRVIFIGYPAACVFIFNTAVLFGAERQRWPLLLLTILAGLQIGINIMMQSSYGIWGAASSFVIYMGIAAIVSTVFILVLYSQFMGFWRALLAPFCAALISLTVLYWAPLESEPAMIGIALAVYAAVIYSTRKWMPGGARTIDFSL